MWPKPSKPGRAARNLPLEPARSQHRKCTSYASSETVAEAGSGRTTNLDLAAAEAGMSGHEPTPRGAEVSEEQDAERSSPPHECDTATTAVLLSGLTIPSSRRPSTCDAPVSESSE
jgi:hypothetical protein